MPPCASYGGSGVAYRALIVVSDLAQEFREVTGESTAAGSTVTAVADALMDDVCAGGVSKGVPDIESWSVSVDGLTANVAEDDGAEEAIVFDKVDSH